MKLLRYGDQGAEKPGLLTSDGCIRDLSGVIGDISGDVLSADGLARLAGLDHGTLPVIGGAPRLGACVSGIGKIICVGLNYTDHAAESGMEVPSEPVIFYKATSSLVGPDDDVLIPRGSEKTDWEVELGVVIGTRASYLSEQNALDHIAGYCVINDLSERDFQLNRGGGWLKGKGCDTFCPLGPWLVTTDEVPDPHSLKMTLSVNGHRYQDGSTATMIYKVPYLVSYISQFMTLEPGDVISTGTPAGVGLGQNPPVFLKAGDVMTLEIEGLGSQKQTVRAA